MTDLLERKRDTPLLLRPGVEIEDDCLLLLLPPEHLGLMSANIFPVIITSHLSTLWTEMFFATKDSGSTASQPVDSTLLLDLSFLRKNASHRFQSIEFGCLRIFSPVTISISMTTILVSSFAPVYWKTASIRTLDKLRLYKPWHKLPGCFPS